MFTLIAQKHWNTHTGAIISRLADYGWFIDLGKIQKSMYRLKETNHIDQYFVSDSFWLFSAVKKKHKGFETLFFWNTVEH